MLGLNFLLAATIATFATSASAALPCDVVSPQVLYQAAKNYIDTWNGDFSLENKTFTPDVTFYQDRLPSPKGTIAISITNSTQFIRFMKRAREGWNQYQIDVRNTAGDGYNVVFRWALNAITGPPDKMTIPVNVPEGTPVTYNGTDWLYLDRCTGKIQQVGSSQDRLTALRAVGITEIKI